MYYDRDEYWEPEEKYYQIWKCDDHPEYDHWYSFEIETPQHSNDMGDKIYL